MKKINLITFIVTSIVAGSTAWTKAYYAPKLEMLENSCAIAVINVTEVKKTKIQGEHWSYSELANVKVEKVIKGNLPSQIELLGEESFICERCRVKPGKYIAFMRPEGKRWACTNWYLSVRPITGTQVEWYTGNASIALSSQPFEEVVKDIESQLAYLKKKDLKDPCRLPWEVR
ncbi:hypothetical protein [Bdellovibrio sp. HCB2-146]|uniref:hypothetical protein n=1 Tax=Bdellovibrio sp. HCB2-146 TaxID=3394362 RepID=UPI0039BD171B